MYQPCNRILRVSATLLLVVTREDKITAPTLHLQFTKARLKLGGML